MKFLTTRIMELLAENGEMTAVDLRMALEPKPPAWWFLPELLWEMFAGPSLGSIYVALSELRTTRCVVSRWGVPPPGRRYRPRLYSLNLNLKGSSH